MKRFLVKDYYLGDKEFYQEYVYFSKEVAEAHKKASKHCVDIEELEFEAIYFENFEMSYKLRDVSITVIEKENTFIFSVSDETSKEVSKTHIQRNMNLLFIKRLQNGKTRSKERFCNILNTASWAKEVVGGLVFDI